MEKNGAKKPDAPPEWENIQMDSPKGMRLSEWYQTRTRQECAGLEGLILYHLSEQSPLFEKELLQELEELRGSLENSN